MQTKDNLPFQVKRLLAHPDVPEHLQVLAVGQYEADVQWIADHFRFRSSQVIDTSYYPISDVGSVLSLGPDSLYELVSTYLGTFPGVVHIIWAYVEIGITLPLSILSEYLLDDVWFPATDDVFIFDPMADWCLELHHEGQFVFAKTTIGSPSTREASTEG